MSENEAKDECIFIISQGRSGSTLLLEILNEIEGVNICGENWAAIIHLSRFNDCLIRTNEYSPPFGDSSAKLTYQEIEETGIKPAWYNIYEYDVIKEKLRDILREMYNPRGEYRRWGFKEIRYGLNSTYEQFERQLDFLKTLFPRSKFIFNTRNVHDLIRSGWWADNPEKSRQTLSYQLACFAEYNSTHPDYSYIMAYEDSVGQSQKVADMFNFIGEPFKSEAYEKVWSQRKDSIV